MIDVVHEASLVEMGIREKVVRVEVGGRSVRFEVIKARGLRRMPEPEGS